MMFLISRQSSQGSGGQCTTDTYYCTSSPFLILNQLDVFATLYHFYIKLLVLWVHFAPSGPGWGRGPLGQSGLKTLIWIMIGSSIQYSLPKFLMSPISYQFCFVSRLGELIWDSRAKGCVNAGAIRYLYKNIRGSWQMKCRYEEKNYARTQYSYRCRNLMRTRSNTIRHREKRAFK